MGPVLILAAVVAGICLGQANDRDEKREQELKLRPTVTCPAGAMNFNGRCVR